MTPPLYLKVGTVWGASLGMHSPFANTSMVCMAKTFNFGLIWPQHSFLVITMQTPDAWFCLLCSLLINDSLHDTQDLKMQPISAILKLWSWGSSWPPLDFPHRPWGKCALVSSPWHVCNHYIHSAITLLGRPVHQLVNAKPIMRQPLNT